MNDLDAIKAASQVLDGPQPHVESPAELPDDPEKTSHLSEEDAVAKAFDDAEKGKEKTDDKGEAEKDAKPEDKDEKPGKPEKPAKPEKAEKVEKAEEDQPEKAEKRAAPEKDDATGQDGEKDRQSEGRKHSEPPARFLPKAKEVWANTPNPVKAEVARMAQEHEAEVSQYRESHENWQKLSKFDQMAKQHNTSVSDALERYTAVDGLLHSNPIEGIRQVLQTVGITPQQYAEFITKNPQASQAPQQRAPDPQVQRTSSEIETLKAEIQTMRQEQAAREIIEPFRASHPRYDELQDDIAFFLSSGKIPQSLSPTERLEAAYDMAERINPRSTSSAVEEEVDPAPVDEPVDDLRGKKSIRGAPNGINPDRKRKLNQDEAIKAAFEQYGL